MSKAFISSTIQESLGVSGVASKQATKALLTALVKQLKKEGRFGIPGFGTFTVRKTKARRAMNPRTGEPVRVKAGKSIRFRASPKLKKSV
jgi:DNA-binding protein HU-beta